jgi:trehalose/maltose hydrolase-like predicted phosphorylase
MAEITRIRPRRRVGHPIPAINTGGTSAGVAGDGCERPALGVRQVWHPGAVITTLRRVVGGRPRLLIGVGVLVAVVLIVVGIVVAVPQGERSAQGYPCPGDNVSGRADWAPESDVFAAGFDRHPFAGNGYLGVRIPPAGMGYVQTGEKTGWPLYTPRYDGAFLAGLYASEPSVADGHEVAAALPNWSTLLVGVGNETYSPTTPSGEVTNFHQTEYLRCGLVHTTLTWTTQDGHNTDLTYDVLTDRTDQHAAAVRLTAVPHWSGQLTVTGLIDFEGARRVDRLETETPNTATTEVGFRTRTTNVTGAVAAVLDTGGAAVQQSDTAQRSTFPVQQGHSYQVTKFVGVDSTLTAPNPQRSAVDSAQGAARRGWPQLLAADATIWQQLWAGDIEISHRPDFQRWTRGALYSLYSATNPQQDNSISPNGLTSDDYGGAIFWDADIWMYPGLLQLNPALAKSVVEYRYKTLPAARANAQRLGYPGAFYPWTSGSTGDLDSECYSWNEQPKPHCLTQIHLQGDIALAAWQYYLATKDTGYLRDRVWPIMSNLAEFWAARATPNPDGGYSIRGVAGPDEYSNDVDDGVYTNAVAAEALRNAASAAGLLGRTAPPQWITVADHLRIPFDAADQVFEQYDGYHASLIKQADAVLLEYPLEWPMSPAVATKTLDYYAKRSDPDGPAMTDAVHEIDAAQNGQPCKVGAFLDRSVRPFIREPFGQFAEARGSKAGAADALAGAPAFDFDTAAGGFIQEFTNGLLGLRFRADRVRLDPLLPPQLGDGFTVHGLHWQGRTFDATVSPEHTTITSTSGPSLPVETPAGVRHVDSDHPLQLPTRRPGLTQNGDVCGPATDLSEQSGGGR